MAALPVDIYTLLRKKFPEREYALMEEVRDKAGFNASRSADFVLMNLSTKSLKPKKMYPYIFRKVLVV